MKPRGPGTCACALRVSGRLVVGVLHVGMEDTLGGRERTSSMSRLAWVFLTCLLPWRRAPWFRLDFVHVETHVSRWGPNTIEDERTFHDYYVLSNPSVLHAWWLATLPMEMWPEALTTVTVVVGGETYVRSVSEGEYWR